MQETGPLSEAAMEGPTITEAAMARGMRGGGADGMFGEAATGVSRRVDAGVDRGFVRASVMRARAATARTISTATRPGPLARGWRTRCRRTLIAVRPVNGRIALRSATAAFDGI